jgi:hypothetical protein
MNRPALLICNDAEFGRALGQSCRARGLGAPGWVALSGGPVAQLSQSAEAFVVGGDAGIDVARALVEGAGEAVVIFVGVSAEAVSERLCVVAPEHDWPGRVVEALIDRLGLTPALLPSYENRLRVLGRELDRRGYTAVSIEELEGGFRIQSEAGSDVELPPLEFSSRDVGRFVRAAVTSRGEPDWERPRGRLAMAGQERLLRYLGGALDRRGATHVRIVTLARSLVVSGYESPSPYDPARPFQELYRASDLHFMQQQAYYRRRQAEGRLRRLMNRLGMS